MNTNIQNDNPTIGFMSAPAWFDPAPAEFPTACVEEVRTQQAPLLLPDFDYKLESIAQTGKDMALCARSLKAIGCNLIAQVGSPFAWAGASTEAQARERCHNLEKASGLPVVMTGLAIVDALRFLGVKQVAANCTYYDAPWRDAFRDFLGMCGFEVVHLSTLADQGLVDPNVSISDYGWSMTPELTTKSIVSVAQAVPDAQAMVITGAGTRTLSILQDMERQTQMPIVAADTIVYWAIAKKLGLKLVPEMGSWEDRV